MKEEIGQRIRKIRSNKDFSQAGMADQLGVTPGVKKIKNESMLELQIFKLLSEMEVLKKELKKIPKAKK